MKLLSAILLGTISFSAWVNPVLAAQRSADYVIVGVGTAGALLARKLTDDGRTSVIALHNGTNLTSDELIKFTQFAPVTVVSALIGPPLYQKGDNIPQVNADNRPIPWVMAVPFGGASSINAGAYCRGTNQVYSQWEAVAGPLWSVDRITNIYKKLEHYVGQTTNPGARGFSGLLNVRQVPNPTIVAEKFNQAMIIATGTPNVLDYNDPNTPIGNSAQLQYTQTGENGFMRESSANAFLDSSVMNPLGQGVGGRKLIVSFASTALKILWSGNTAIGVEYLYNGSQVKRVYANKGVIIAAGLKSSALLLHSGVGPASTLGALGIPVIFDNPNVGQGLADQPQVQMLFASNPFDTPLQLGLGLFLLDTQLPLTSQFAKTTLGAEFYHLFNTQNVLNDILNPNAAKNFSRQGAGNNSIFTQISWLPDPSGDPTVRKIRFAFSNLVPGFTLGLLDLVQPESRGSITIDKSNPASQPVIDDGFLNSNDLDLYVRAFQVYVQNLNVALQAIDPGYYLILPDPDILSDANAIREYVKASVVSNMCFQSHCRMAALSQGGVVDNEGRVYGTQNLYVADDSIVPVPMDGTTMASAYLIAFNIAKIIMGT